MTVTQTLPLALTPKAHPAGIPAFLYAEAGALLIPSSCTEESPNGQNPLKPSELSLESGKESIV